MAEIGGIAKDQILSIVERIEEREQEKAHLVADIRELYGEAKNNGFDTKVLRQIVRIRRTKDYAEEMALLEVYKDALGMSNHENKTK